MSTSAERLLSAKRNLVGVQAQPGRHEAVKKLRRVSTTLGGGLRFLRDLEPYELSRLETLTFVKNRNNLPPFSSSVLSKADPEPLRPCNTRLQPFAVIISLGSSPKTAVFEKE